MPVLFFPSGQSLSGASAAGNRRWQFLFSMSLQLPVGYLWMRRRSSLCLSVSSSGPQGQEDEAQGAHYLFLILGDVWAPCGLVSVSRNAIHGSEKLRPAHTQAKRMTPPALTSLKTKKPVPEVILFYNGLEASRPRFILPAHVARARARGRL